MSKQDKKELRQQIACEWLQENYLNYGSLRHDVVTDRLQIRLADLNSLEDASLQKAPRGYSLEARKIGATLPTRTSTRWYVSAWRRGE